jgi:hypothetical protein
MTRGKPSIEAEQYAVPGKPGADGKLALHSFRYEVFDLLALVGHTEQCHDAGEIMTVAVSAARDGD